MAKTHLHHVTVYYEDTDFSGVVYYANYLRYFEQGRDRFFGMTELVEMWKKTGIGFAVYKAEIHYKEGAKFGDELEIRTTVTPESDYRILVDQQVWRPGGSNFLVKGIIQMVCMDKDNKLVAVPDWVKDRIAERNRE